MAKSLRCECGAVLMVVVGAVVVVLAAFADVLGELSAVAVVVGLALAVDGAAQMRSAPTVKPYDWEVMG